MYYVYILASQRNGTLYTGVTGDVVRRTSEHRLEITDGFTKRYGVKNLVYVEEHQDIEFAIQREKNIKHWPRRWKVDLIETANPTWNDLFLEVWH